MRDQERNLTLLLKFVNPGMLQASSVQRSPSYLSQYISFMVLSQLAVGF